ncbi:MAG: class I SAM-dependent methyltransferase [Acidobacteria bacterium]|nr:class I SAM-dependent methyltransferase [Acidobacteriota bacterium]
MSDLLALTAAAEATHFWFHGFRAYIRPVIQQIAGGRRDLRILDGGCGTGYNMRVLLAPHGRAFGFDMHVDAMRRARAAGRPLVRANMEQIPFASGSFDVVTSFDVMQSVHDDRRAMRELARVLKPGGHLVLNVTALDFMGGDHGDVWGELRRYTPTRARRLLAQAGLEPIRISFLFGSLLPLMLAVRVWQRIQRLWRTPHGDEDLIVPSPPINALLTALVRGEAALTRRVPIPFGSSLMIVARKPS